VVLVVQSERAATQFPCLTGKKQGNFKNSGPIGYPHTPQRSDYLRYFGNEFAFNGE
jgi:hypothetical protein